MKVLVINASANKEKSTTLKLTKCFLEGLGEEAEFVNTIDLKVNPCRACYSCWFRTPGKCCQKDDAQAVMDKILEADLVIWNAPDFEMICYRFGSNLVDRVIKNGTLVAGER